jgi:hypothetical protein
LDDDVNPLDAAFDVIRPREVCLDPGNTGAVEGGAFVVNRDYVIRFLLMNLTLLVAIDRESAASNVSRSKILILFSFKL